MTKRFYLAALLAFLGILLGTSWPQLSENGAAALDSGTFLDLAAGAYEAQAVIFVLPLVSVLPMGEAYLKERQWNFLRFSVSRTGRRAYCQDKVLRAAFLGPLAWLLGTAAAVLFFFLLFFAREAKWTGPWDRLAGLLVLTGRSCLAASSLSSLSAALGALSRSVYLAWGVPFLSVYACMILRQRYLEELYCIDPQEWILCREDWGSAGTGLWAFLLLLALLSAIFHSMILRYRLEEL